jgi:hypothetical protein
MMPSTSGSSGSWLWLTIRPGQMDCSGTLTAPASRADVGGCTVWSSVVHSDSHGGRSLAGESPSEESSELPGTSCSHATGHSPGTNVSPSAARFVPCSGDPSVMIRAARAPPS